MGNDSGLIWGVIAAVVAQLVTFGSLMFNSRQQRLREERNRKWEVEDRAELAKQVVTTSAQLATKVHETSVELASKVIDTSAALAKTVTDTSAVLAEKVDATTKAITDAIAENTVKTERAAEAAHEAYKEANNVNLKIASLGLKAQDGNASSSPPPRERRESR